jgi:NACHT domain
LFISQYTQGHRKLSDLVVDQATSIKEEIFSENNKTRDVVSAQLRAQELAQLTTGQCERLLSSLTYDDMNARKSRITESHEKTFHWIFDDTTVRAWDSFPEWLKSGERVYWISGKAGSGKSTLMKFLIHDIRTKDALSGWAPNATIISFFIWTAGNPMQRSIQGLLCALLQQVLTMDQDLIWRLIAERPELLRKKSYSDWSVEEVESVLIQGISMLAQPLCIFLDGLDEIDRDEGCFNLVALVALINKLRSKTSAKLCISSRPEELLRDALSTYPSLRLQDLTKADISIFVADFLQKHFQFKDVDVDGEKLQRKVIDEILERADGVFLWVHLVLKSLLSGKAHVDSYEQLSKRIRRLPRELENLYKETWKRHGEDESLYLEEAARYFRLVLENRKSRNTRSFSLFQLFIATNDKIQRSILEGNVFPPVKKLISEAGVFRRRVESCCGGLLEFWSDKASPAEEAPEEVSWVLLSLGVENFSSQFVVPLSAYIDPALETTENTPEGSDLAKLWDIFYRVKVDFIHRTAADFLLETTWGSSIMRSDSATPADIQVRIYRSQLIDALLFMFPWHNNGRRDMDDFFYELQDIGDISNEMRQSLLILFADTFERLLDRSYVIEFVIKELRLQIRNGQFDHPYCKIMCDFVVAETLEGFQSCYTSEDIKATSRPIARNSRMITSKRMSSIRKACLQIFANYASNTPDLLRDVNWPPDVPKFPVLRRAVTPSEGLLGYIFADMLFMTWLSVDARWFVRYNTATIVGKFFRAAAALGLVEILHRCFERRKNAYDNIKNFKELLLFTVSYYPVWRPQRLEWRNDEAICWLLQIGANPNWKDQPEYYDPQHLTSFEVFLISVPQICLSLTKGSIGPRIATAIRAYIKAGANLDRVICISRSACASSTWQPPLSAGGVRHDKPEHGRLDITIECNTCQLVRFATSFMQHYLSRQYPEIVSHLEDLGNEIGKCHRKVLLVSKIDSANDQHPDIHWAVASPNDSDRIFGLFDSEGDSERWLNMGSTFEAELQSLLKSIIENGEQVVDADRWLELRGHPREYGYRTDLLGYMRDNATPFYGIMFPDLAYDKGIGDDAIDFEDRDKCRTMKDSD